MRLTYLILCCFPLVSGCVRESIPKQSATSQTSVSPLESPSGRNKQAESSDVSNRPAKPLSLPSLGATTQSNLKVGDMFPELQGEDLKGNRVVLDQSTRGEKYTLIVFWSTWCGFCMTEMPHEIELGKKYQAAGLRIIGINADASRDEGLAAAEQRKLPWLNLYEGKDRSVSTQLGIDSWPALFLLDANGKIVSATEQLRRHAVVEMTDGTVQQKYYLDWTLETLLEASSSGGS